MQLCLKALIFLIDHNTSTCALSRVMARCCYRTVIGSQRPNIVITIGPFNLKTILAIKDRKPS